MANLEGGVGQRIAAFEFHAKNSTSKIIAKTSSFMAPLKNVKNLISQLESKAALSLQTVERKKAQNLWSATTSLVRPSKFRHLFCAPSASLPLPPDVSFPLNSQPICHLNERYCVVGVSHRFHVFEWRNASDSTSSNASSASSTLAFGSSSCAEFGGVRLLDIRWNPHGPDMLAFSGSGGAIGIWRCSSFSSVAQPPSLTLVTSFRHSKDAHLVRWHPTSPEILVGVSAPDHRIAFYDVVRSTQIAVIGVHRDFICGVAWSRDGNHFVTFGKDGFVRFFDASCLSSGGGEVASLTLTTQFRAHSAIKPLEVTLLKDGRVFSSGFTQTSMREIALWPNPMSGNCRVDTPLFRETVGYHHLMFSDT